MAWEPVWIWKRTVDPATEPITLEAVKKHLELDQDSAEHDAHLVSLLRAAREQWEHDTQQALLNQTWAVWCQSFPCDSNMIRLPIRPVSSVTSIQYYDAAGVLQTLSDTLYTVTATIDQVRLNYGQSWPSTEARPDAVKITYVAGYGTSSSAVPPLHKQAMLLQIGKWFADREMMSNELIYQDKAYERIVLRNQRASYP